MINSLLATISSAFLALPLLTTWMMQPVIIVVGAGGDLQAALVSAKCGDTVVVEAAATFTVSSKGGNFLLPAKPGCSGTEADYITVRSSKTDQLPVGRVGLGDKANMAKIVALGPGGAFGTQDNSRYWKLVGLEITNSSSGTSAEHVGTLNEIGNYQTGVKHIWFDRSYVHPQEDGTTDYTRTVTRGFGVNNVEDFRLTNSYVSGFLGEYSYSPDELIDSEALATNVGDGYLLENNFLQGYFNTIFLGGGGTSTNNTGIVQASPAPTFTSATLSTVANLAVGDYISFPQTTGENANGRIQSISGNAVTFSSLKKFTLAINPPIGDWGVAVPPIPGSSARWNGVMVRNFVSRRNTYDIDTVQAQWEFTNRRRQMPKGYLEIKHCDTCSFEGDTFQGWPSYIALNAVNQNGDSPWTTIKNFSLRNCWIKNFSDAFRVALGNPTGSATWHITAEGSNIAVENNLFTQTNTLPDDYGMTKIGIWGFGNGVTIRHNTFINNTSKGGPMFSSNGPITSFKFQDNIAWNNLYGMNCGLGSFSACYPNWIEGKNVIVNNSGDVNSAVQAIYPNSFVSSDLAGVGFADPTNGNYRLSPTSPYKGKATDGKDPGVDIDQLTAALGGSGSTPQPSPTPTASPTPTPIASPSPTPTATPTPTPEPTVEPTPFPSPTPEPTPFPCTLDAPASISVPPNGVGKIGVSLNSMTPQIDQFLIRAFSGTPGQVFVFPDFLPVTGTSATIEFGVRVKKRSAIITFTSPCPTKTTVVMVQ
jgi:hypothetical protein